MSSPIIKVENLSKQYRLGEVGTGTISHDLNRWWHRIRGKEDPYLRIGESNDRSKKGNSEYVWALQDINFEVQQGEVLGIIGKNGAGKSTLLKILSKVTAPTTGSVKAKGRIASLLEVGTGFHPELTGRENIYLNGTILGMTKKEVTAKLDEIVDFAGVERYLDTPVKRYSSGMTVRLGFAVAAHLEPEILIVDEVLAVGDAEFQKKAVGKMQEVSKEGGRTVLFVSHNMGVIKNICSTLIMIDNGVLVEIGDTEKIIQSYIRSIDKNLQNIKIEDNILTFNDIATQEIKINYIKFNKISFQTNDSMYININIWSKKNRLRNLIIGIGINDYYKNMIYHLSNVFVSSNLNYDNTNDLDFIFNMPLIRLKPGIYSLVFFISEAGVVRLWSIDEFSFEILESNAYGLTSSIEINGVVQPEFNFLTKKH